MNTTRIISTLVLSAAAVFAANQPGSTYLALGDSVPFGMNISLLPPYSTQIPKPSDFVGYPDTVAALVHFGKEVNAACPGETSGSFLNVNVPDNGCNFPHPEPPPLQPIPPAKPQFLHTPYTVAQMDFALSQLTPNNHVSLVTLSIGANDILMALPQLEQCLATPSCDPGSILNPVLGNYASNLAQILTRIRSQYRGTLILMTYYSPAPALDGVTQALNGTMLNVASQLNGQPGFPTITIADGYTAFRVVSAPFGGDACQAGLLIKLPPGPFTTTPCDIHPSPLGRDILAATVVLTQGGNGR